MTCTLIGSGCLTLSPATQCRIVSMIAMEQRMSRWSSMFPTVCRSQHVFGLELPRLSLASSSCSSSLSASSSTLISSWASGRPRFRLRHSLHLCLPKLRMTCHPRLLLLRLLLRRRVLRCHHGHRIHCPGPMDTGGMSFRRNLRTGLATIRSC